MQQQQQQQPNRVHMQKAKVKSRQEVVVVVVVAYVVFAFVVPVRAELPSAEASFPAILLRSVDPAKNQKGLCLSGRQFTSLSRVSTTLICCLFHVGNLKRQGLAANVASNKLPADLRKPQKERKQ